MPKPGASTTGRAGRVGLGPDFKKGRRAGPGLGPGLEPFIIMDSRLSLGFGLGPGFGPEIKKIKSGRAGHLA